MTPGKPESKVLMFYDPKGADPEKCLAAVHVSAAHIVQLSNYADLKDKQDRTICTVTWPSAYKLKVV